MKEKTCEWCHSPILEDGDCITGCGEYDRYWKSLTKEEQDIELLSMDEYSEDVLKMRIQELNTKELKRYVDTGELPER